MRTLTTLSLVLFSLFLPFASLGAPTFGAEFTMTSNELIQAPMLNAGTDDDISSNKGRELIAKFAKIVAEKCGGCTVTPAQDRYGLPIYKVTLPDGFSFMITLDPAVIEVVPKAATLEGFKKLEPVLQKLIFETGKALNQAPQSSYGGGHVHIGISSAFGGNPVLFRNFFVDWLNHPDLMNAFTGSKYNAPTFYDLPADRERAMREVIAEFDARLRAEGFIERPERDAKRGFELMAEFAREVQKRVYTRTVIAEWTPTEKYQALNVTRLADPEVPFDQKTIELRFFAGQKSVSEFIGLISMFEGRIDHLKKTIGLSKYEGLRTYSAAETAARLDRFAREAGTSSSDVRDAVQQRSVLELIPKASFSCEAAILH